MLLLSSFLSTGLTPYTSYTSTKPRETYFQHGRRSMHHPLTWSAGLSIQLRIRSQGNIFKVSKDAWSTVNRKLLFVCAVYSMGHIFFG